MTRLLLVLFLLGAGLVGLHGPSVTHAAGNSDAAHACQNGGYTSLQGTDGTTFKNEGQCIGYAAKGGAIVGLNACIVTSTTGCLTFNGVTLLTGDGKSMTVTGTTSFLDTCIGLCLEPSMPNSGATGGGTYTERDSSGQVISSGIYRIADTPGTVEGLDGVLYLDANDLDTDCAGGSGWREVDTWATLIDSTTGAQQWGFFAANTGMGPGPVAWAIVGNDYFTAPVPTNTITC